MRLRPRETGLTKKGLINEARSFHITQNFHNLGTIEGCVKRHDYTLDRTCSTWTRIKWLYFDPGYQRQLDPTLDFFPFFEKRSVAWSAWVPCCALTKLRPKDPFRSHKQPILAWTASSLRQQRATFCCCCTFQTTPNKYQLVGTFCSRCWNNVIRGTFCFRLGFETACVPSNKLSTRKCKLEISIMQQIATCVVKQSANFTHRRNNYSRRDDS